ncbi:MAG: histidine phosphatase family protein [Patescibacteria group bacterium]|nr:histidine phosphatase family protein [Patescibacteria group bacterium]
MKGLITFDKGKKDGRKVAILRHGQTLLNREDRIRGWSNIPLDDKGIEQAQDLGIAMVEGKIELDGLITSDLLRCLQTSLEVSKMTGIPILGTTKALRPWNVGNYTGKDGPTVHKIMVQFAKKMPNEELGGGESFNQFKFRVLAGIISLLNSNRGLKIGFVSHSRGERILHSWVAEDCNENLDVDLDVFQAKGEEPATMQMLTIDCPLVLT